MKILGVVVEYNPFHNGHLYHLNESIKATACDLVIAVMSGNFVQRGEPALIDKWARTRQAILGGVDVVIELPFVYSVSSAQNFAMGAVSILDRLNCVDYLCFGTEVGNLDRLWNVAKVIVEEDYEFKDSLRRALSLGNSFARAREIALCEKCSKTFNNETLTGSNNILAIEYLTAILRLNSKIKPITIKRVSNQYNSKELNGDISSATSIRNNIKHLDKIQECVPDFAYKILLNEIKEGRGPINLMDFENMIISNIRKLTTKQFSQIPDVCEGLENRFKNICDSTGSLSGFIEKLQTKRYPSTRINRILINSLIGIDKESILSLLNGGGAQFARVLGFSKKGEKALKQIKETSTIPIITNFKILKQSCNPLVKKMAEIEKLATDLYVIASPNADARVGSQDFSRQIIKNVYDFL